MQEVDAMSQATIDSGWIGNQSYARLPQPSLRFIEEPFQSGAHGLILHGAEGVCKRDQATFPQITFAM
jgi:hypothetical protein